MRRTAFTGAAGWPVRVDALTFTPGHARADDGSGRARHDHGAVTCGQWLPRARPWLEGHHGVAGFGIRRAHRGGRMTMPDVPLHAVPEAGSAAVAVRQGRRSRRGGIIQQLGTPLGCRVAR